MAQEASAAQPAPGGDALFGEQVHHQMWRQRVYQHELAKALNLDASTMSKKLRGDRSWTIDEIVGTTRFLGISYDDLMPGAEYQPTYEGRRRRSDEPEPPAPAVGGGAEYAIRDSNPEPADYASAAEVGARVLPFPKRPRARFSLTNRRRSWGADVVRLEARVSRRTTAHTWHAEASS